MASCGGVSVGHWWADAFIAGLAILAHLYGKGEVREESEVYLQGGVVPGCGPADLVERS